jgi:hypothetical protein
MTILSWSKLNSEDFYFCKNAEKAAMVKNMRKFKRNRKKFVKKKKHCEFAYFYICTVWYIPVHIYIIHTYFTDNIVCKDRVEYAYK